MEITYTNAVNTIIAIQSLGAWLEIPMRFFTFLGSEYFLFIVLPLIYWSINSRLGLQVAFILAASNCLKPLLKMAFAQPRPYWVSSQVKAFVAEESFGIPSGHAQDAAAIWTVMAYGIRKRWAWIAAPVLVFLIGFSRLYLGAHFVWDVLAGWLIGGLLLLAFILLWDRVSAWFSSKTFALQVAIPFIISMVVIAVGAWEVAGLDGYVLPQEWIDNALRAGTVPDPVSMESVLTAAGSFFGLATGAAWIASRGGYQASGPVEKRVLRYAIGLIGVLILWMGLGMIFPQDENVLSYILRYFRYAVVGFWVIAGAPWLFFRFKLADPPKM